MSNAKEAYKKEYEQQQVSYLVRKIKEINEQSMTDLLTYDRDAAISELKKKFPAKLFEQAEKAANK